MIGLVIVGVVIVIGAVILIATPAGDQNNDSEGSGSVIVSVTDAAANMENVSEVELQLEGVELQKQDGEWTEISGKNETYALLQLNESGNARFYENADVAAGTYDRMRVELDEATVITSDGQEREAVTPAEMLTIEAQTRVETDATSTVEFDFKADQSLQTTTDGEYVFAPVVAVSTQSGADVSVEGEEGPVTTSGGEITSEITVGVDATGESKENFQLGADAELEISEDGQINVLGSSANTETGAEATTSAETTVEDGLEATDEAASNAAGEAEAVIEGAAGVNGQTQNEAGVETQTDGAVSN